MARGAQNITSTYTNTNALAKPSNLFTQVNLDTQKGQGTSSYDNAEMVSTLSDVYTVAQQMSSILMPLFEQEPMTACFNNKIPLVKCNMCRRLKKRLIRLFMFLPVEQDATLCCNITKVCRFTPLLRECVDMLLLQNIKCNWPLRLVDCMTWGFFGLLLNQY